MIHREREAEAAVYSAHIWETLISPLQIQSKASIRNLKNNKFISKHKTSMPRTNIIPWMIKGNSKNITISIWNSKIMTLIVSSGWRPWISNKSSISNRWDLASVEMASSDLKLRSLCQQDLVLHSRVITRIRCMTISCRSIPHHLKNKNPIIR